MKAKEVGDGEQTTHVLVFEKGEEVMAGLLEFVNERRISSGHLTAIGAFSDVTLGFFERESKDYRRIPLREQVEAVSLVGGVALKGSEPQVHAHVVVARSDGSAYGGHLLEAHVWPTLEVVLVETPAHLQRELDEETGLPLIRL
jgi:predicted DNA-binding protein with PD1-like motif